MGQLKPENPPEIQWSSCTKAAGCKPVRSKFVIDANWRWTHNQMGHNCYTGNLWNPDICPASRKVVDTCSASCVVDGGNYQGDYGVTTSQDSLSIRLVTQNQNGRNVGARLLLLDEDGNEYVQHRLLDREISFDVDVHSLDCGIVSAVYFVGIDADGGAKKYGSSGAKAGLGYGDAQCARDLKFINGKANNKEWVPSKSDPNAGVGLFGSCATELDVWEGNSMSNAFTLHPSTAPNQQICQGDQQCGGTFSKARYGTFADPDGCDLNPYRFGNPQFYGKGKVIDTSQKFTVTTQFLTSATAATNKGGGSHFHHPRRSNNLEKRITRTGGGMGSASRAVGGGDLVEVRRLYAQNGKAYPSPAFRVQGVEGNSLTPQTCQAAKKAFGDPDIFSQKGGFSAMSKAMRSGMSLVVSLWTDHYANALWLDSSYSRQNQGTGRGVARGPCPSSGGDPKEVEASNPEATFTISNIRIGDIGSTQTSSANPVTGGMNGGGRHISSAVGSNYNPTTLSTSNNEISGLGGSQIPKQRLPTSRNPVRHGGGPNF